MLTRLRRAKWEGHPIDVDDVAGDFWEAVTRETKTRSEPWTEQHLGTVLRNVLVEAAAEASAISRRTYGRIQDALEQLALVGEYEPSDRRIAEWMKENCPAGERVGLATIAMRRAGLDSDVDVADLAAPENSDEERTLVARSLDDKVTREAVVLAAAQNQHLDENTRDQARILAASIMASTSHLDELRAMTTEGWRGRLRPFTPGELAAIMGWSESRTRRAITASNARLRALVTT